MNTMPIGTARYARIFGSFRFFVGGAEVSTSGAVVVVTVAP
jgi:hypothetical protein